MECRLINLLHTTLEFTQVRQLHSLIVTSFPNLLPLFVKRLLNLSFIGYARQVFGQIPEQEQTLHSFIIYHYSRHSLHQEAIQQFMFMRSKHTPIDGYTIPPVLKSCSSLLDVGLGKQIHSLVINCGLVSNVYVQTALVDFYAKTGDLGSSKLVFDGILVKDPVCYNCLISGYSKSGDVVMARKLFDEMGERTIGSWNAMLSCYAHNGDYAGGFKIFERMLEEKCRANEFTVTTVLSICAKLGNLEMGLGVKKFIDDNNICMNMIVSTALVEMYVKCGLVDEARGEFDRMIERDVVAWSAMIAGYAQNQRCTEALELFEKMQSENVKSDVVTLASVLSACAQLGSVEAGERIGSYVESHGFDSNTYTAAALLDMYSRCGNIRKARQIFDKMPHKDVVTWNSMIMGLAVNGFAEDAFVHYEKMKQLEIKPDDITFVGLLTACKHAGLLEPGLDFFQAMRLEQRISPKVEHYACIIDLYCKSGGLNQAYEFICQMEVEPNAVIWGTLLNASRIHLNVELAEICVSKLLQIEPENSGNYVLLSNIYASLGRWQEALSVRSLMKDKRLQKTAAYSWIELERKVHKFLVDDKSHPRSEDVCSTVDGLAIHSTWDIHDFEHELEFC